MGAPGTYHLPDVQQTAIPAVTLEPLVKNDWGQCPKYNWTKMDPWERISANVLDAVGPKTAVVSAVFGLVIFSIILVFFRSQVTNLIFGKKEDK